MNAKNDYELYHDESMIDGYWHGMLFIPADQKTRLLSYLETARNEIGYFHKISFKKINSAGQKYELANSWLSIILGFMRSDPKFEKYPYYSGKKENRSLYINYLDSEACGAKFVLFKDRDHHEKMVNYSDSTSKIETTFRIGFKGGLHFLFDPQNPICVTHIHFDGFEHLGRHIDRERVIGRIHGLRDYCEIDNSLDIIDDRSSDPNNSNAQNYEDCQLLQLTDLLIGSFRSGLGYSGNHYKNILGKYAKFLIERYMKGTARMHNSRWNHGFCMSQCYLENDQWHFEMIELSENTKVKQLALFE